MDLRSAVKAVAAFAHKDAAPHIALAPAYFDVQKPIVLLDGEYPLPVMPAWALAWDGETGISVDLDMGDDVPHVALEAASAAKAFAQVKARGEYRLERTGRHITTLNIWNTAAVAIPSDPPERVTIIAKRPRRSYRLEPEQVALLLSVVHACSRVKKEDRVELTRVRLTPWYAEATDTVRVARADVGFVPHDVCVSKNIFKKWPARYPKYGVSWALEDGYFCLQVGEEQRFTKAYPGDTHYDLSALVPRRDHGSHIVVAAESLLNAAEQAANTSIPNVVAVSPADASVEVCGILDDGSPSSRAVLPFRGPRAVPTRIMVRAKLLVEAAYECARAASEVSLHYTDHLGPLRLSAPGYTELIWPLTGGGGDSSAESEESEQPADSEV